MPTQQTILLAEDEPNILLTLTFLLERAGFLIQSETNGIKALETIIATPPDAVILDVMLPDLDGFEILKKLRANPTTETLPILMLTAKGQSKDRNNALDYGANLFITKPFANAEVIAAVNTLTAEKP